jgi:hypothetical protein
MKRKFKEHNNTERKKHNQNSQTRLLAGDGEE